MIILKKLSSENNLFETISFKEGINIIQGISSQKLKGRDANGVGKSSIVRLVDFCLGAKKTFFKGQKYEFLKKDTIVLELEIDNKNYTIKRNFNDEFFLIEEDKQKQQFSLDEIKQFLSNKFFPQGENIELPNNAFRNLIKFFIKDDISKIRQDKPFKFEPIGSNTDLYWFNLNLYLMRIENNLFIEYDANEKKLKIHKKEKSEYEKLLKERYNRPSSDLQRELIQLEQEINALKKVLKEYKYTSFQEIEKDIINIGQKLKTEYINLRNIKKDISNLKESISYDTNIDIEEIKKQYREIKEIFAEIIAKELNKIIEFNQRVQENRERFLKEFLKELEEKEKKISNTINELEEKRGDIININLNDKDTHFITDKIRYSVEKLAEKSDIKARLELIKNTEKNILEFEKKIYSLKQSILENKTNRIDQLNKIKKIFNENFDLLLTSNNNQATFDIISDVSKKILDIEFQIPQLESKGNLAYSFLLYDISFFFHLIYSKHNLPYFLFHDGAFGEGIFTNKLINFINNINQKLDGYRYQYIVTLNEDNIREEDKNNFNFDFDEKIIVKLNQNSPFFKRNF